MIAGPNARTLLLAAVAVVAALVSPSLSCASELLMFERAGCAWCQRWNREIAPVYGKAAESRLLPLRRIDIDQARESGVTLAAPVRFTPTFVVVEDGREVGRITGYFSDDAFWGLLGALAAKLGPPPREANRI